MPTIAEQWIEEGREEGRKYVLEGIEGGLECKFGNHEANMAREMDSLSADFGSQRGGGAGNSDRDWVCRMVISW